MTDDATRFRAIAAALKKSAHSALALAVHAAGERRVLDALALYVSAFAQAVAQGATESVARRLEASVSAGHDVPDIATHDGPSLVTAADKRPREKAVVVEDWGRGVVRRVELPDGVRGRVVRGGDS